MSGFFVESITLNVDASCAYDYIRNPANLPRWTNAFHSISDNSAVMETPKGRIEVGLPQARFSGAPTLGGLHTPEMRHSQFR